MTVSAAPPDIVERLSYASMSKDGDQYTEAKTPVVELEDGALRAGGRPDIWSRDYIGVLIQYVGVGMVYGTLPATVYPVLQRYLNMEGTQIVSASVLIKLPWSFKVFYGILSDCFPIFGYRRRPFMIIGWTMCGLMLLLMATTKMGEPYYMDSKLVNKKPSLWTAADKLNINYNAPDVGGKLIVFMMLAAVGYVGADVAADGMVVELAQREPEAVRGTTQTTIYMIRTIFVTGSIVLVGFFFNGEDYGGEFSFSLTFPQLMLILTLCTLPVIPCTWFFIKEDKHPGVNFKNYMSEFWELLQSRAVYQVIAYKFFSGIFENLGTTVSSPIATHWAKVMPINETIANVAGHAIFAAILWGTMKKGLSWDWRFMHAITMVCVVVVDSITTMLTTWDVVRSQWFWLGPPIIENIPQGISFIVAAYVVVELAGEGNEGAVYGLITTVSNLSGTFASTITKNIGAGFKVTTVDIAEDTNDVRWNVTYVLLIAYGANLFSLIFLPMLPAQKRQTQELKAKGGKSKIIGAFTVFYLVFALCWAVMVNIMSIYPSTKCHKFVGGKGCKKAPAK